MVLRCAQYGPDQHFTDIQLYVFLFATHNTSRDRPIITTVSKRSFRQQKTNIMEISQTLNVFIIITYFVSQCREADNIIYYYIFTVRCWLLHTCILCTPSGQVVSPLHAVKYYVVTETDHNPCYTTTHDVYGLLFEIQIGGPTYTHIIIWFARVLRVCVLYVMRCS